MKVTLPYLSVAKSYERFGGGDLDAVVEHALHVSMEQSCYVEFVQDSLQLFLFFRDHQIYSAGRIDAGQLGETTIKDVFLAASQMSGAAAACYTVNSKILHSVLIIFQKKPTLKFLTSLVDLDKVLDKIEEEGKSCIVGAVQEGFFSLLRYEKGKPAALCHDLSLPVPRERSFREDFLVQIYTRSAREAVEITLYEDMLVKYAGDAKMIDDDNKKSVSSIYLSKPPTVTLEFKGKELGHWILDRPVIRIGRTADNDIQIDNLAVSRLHAVFEKDKGEHFIRDCDSLNGTIVNGQRVGRAKLRDGDEILIGKHKLIVRARGGRELLPRHHDTFDRTMIIGGGESPPAPPLPPAAPQRESEPRRPRLVERTQWGDVVLEIEKPSVVLGKDVEADIAIDGLGVAGRHAEIERCQGDYVIRHLHGIRRVTVDGKPVKEAKLKNNDSIKIGRREFVFQE